MRRNGHREHHAPGLRGAGQALPGSTPVKHLQAVAAEAGCGADVYRLFEDLADRVPLLTAVRPNGERSIEEFEDAGGTRT